MIKKRGGQCCIERRESKRLTHSMLPSLQVHLTFLLLLISCR